MTDGVPSARSAAATDRGMGRGGGEPVPDAHGLGPDRVLVDDEPDPVDASEARCAGLFLPSPQP